MKTSEFIKYFEDEGYRVYKGKTIITVEDENGNDILHISETNSIATDYIAFDNLPFSKQQEYYKVIFNYLMTPIEEREEEKKYYLRHKGFKDYAKYLNYRLRDKTFTINDKSNSNSHKTQFTQKEIDTMPECYTHPAVWEQVEVECKD